MADFNPSENNRKVAKWAILAFIGTCLSEFFIVGMTYNTLSMYMTPILEEFPNISRTVYAATLTGMSLISVACEFTIGKVRDKIGIRWMFVMGCVGAGIAIFIYSIASNIGLIWVAALLFGASVAYCCGSWSGSVISTWFAKKNATLLGIGMLCSGIAATIFSPVVGNWISTIGYRASLRIEFIILIITAVVVFIIVRMSPEKLGLKKLWEGDPEEEEKKSKTSRFRSADAVEPYDVPFSVARKSFPFWACIITSFIAAVAIYSVMNSLSVYSQLDLGFDAVQAGTVLAVMFALNSFGPPVIGILNDTFGIKIISPIMMGIYIISLIVLIVGPPSLGTLYVGAIGTGLALSNARLVMPTLCRGCFGSKYYTHIIGFLTGALSLGIAFSSLFINAIFDGTGSYKPGFAINAVLVAIAAVLIVLAWNKGQKLQKDLREQNKGVAIEE